jgi:hypothetical protein
MDWWVAAIPPLLWVTVAWLSPFLRTYRHRLSGGLSLVAGGLMFASLRMDNSAFPILLSSAGVALTLMFLALYWPTEGKDQNCKGR